MLAATDLTRSRWFLPHMSPCVLSGWLQYATLLLISHVNAMKQLD